MDGGCQTRKEVPPPPQPQDESGNCDGGNEQEEDNDSDSDSGDSDSGNGSDSDEDEDSDSGSSNDGSDSDEDGESDSSGSGDSDTDSEDESQKSGNGKSESEESQKPDKPGNGVGSTDNGEQSQTLDDILSEAVDNLTDSNDLEDIAERVFGNGSGSALTNGITGTSLVPASASDFAFKRAMVKTLKKLVQDSEPGWNRQTPYGKLRVKRLHNDKPETWYDRYDPGFQEETSMEIVFCPDISGSMSSHSLELGKAIWAIQAAAKETDSSLTILPWHSHTEQWKARHIPGQIHVPDIGGNTKPEGAIMTAAQIVERSSKARKLVMFMTDGSWHSMSIDRPKQVSDLLTQRGDTDSILFLYQPTEGYRSSISLPSNVSSYFPYRVEIGDLMEMAKQLESFCKAVLQRRVWKP